MRSPSGRKEREKYSPKEKGKNDGKELMRFAGKSAMSSADSPISIRCACLLILTGIASAFCLTVFALSGDRTLLIRAGSILGILMLAEAILMIRAGKGRGIIEYSPAELNLFGFSDRQSEILHHGSDPRGGKAGRDSPSESREPAGKSDYHG